MIRSSNEELLAQPKVCAPTLLAIRRTSYLIATHMLFFTTAAVSPKTLNPKLLNPDATLSPKTLNPKLLNPKSQILYPKP